MEKQEEKDQQYQCRSFQSAALGFTMIPRTPWCIDALLKSGIGGSLEPIKLKTKLVHRRTVFHQQLLLMYD